MPWCAQCDRFLSPPTVRADGTCPQCGRPVDAGGAHAPADTHTPDDDAVPAPWHLKVLGGGLAVYLGYRAWQGVEWVLHRL